MSSVKASARSNPSAASVRSRRQHASRHSQLGMGFIGLLFFAAVIGGLGYIGLQAFPAYAEYMKINRVVKKVANEGSRTAPEIQSSFDRSASVEDIRSVKGADLGIDVSSGKPVVTFAYSKKIPLIPPASLVFDFEGRGN